MASSVPVRIPSTFGCGAGNLLSRTELEPIPVPEPAPAPLRLEAAAVEEVAHRAQ